ncbi:MAG: hypothetical protein WC233_06255 [Sphaerochaeta sp.]|jgi:hypothetical protein
MADLQREILQKKRQISHHLEDLSSLYGELGRTYVPLDDHPFTYIIQEKERRYAEACQTYEEAKHSYEQIAGYIRQIEDRSRKIGEIQRDIVNLAKEEQQVHAQLGAMAWEAYGFNTLSGRSYRLCDPIFHEHYQLTAKLTKASARQKPRSVARMVTLRRLSRSRHKLESLLIQAGERLAKAGWEEDLALERVPGLQEELGRVRTLRDALTEELEVHQSAVARLKSEETTSPEARLEVSRRHMSEAETESQGRAVEYGMALYEQLAGHSQASAVPQVFQVTLHRKRIQRLEEEIQQLGNLIEAEELRAQILLESRRVVHLRSQMEGIGRQIAQLDASILEKQRKIDTLVPQKDEDSHE